MCIIPLYMPFLPSIRRSWNSRKYREWLLRQHHRVSWLKKRWNRSKILPLDCLDSIRSQRKFLALLSIVFSRSQISPSMVFLMSKGFRNVDGLRVFLHHGRIYSTNKMLFVWVFEAGHGMFIFRLQWSPYGPWSTEWPRQDSYYRTGTPVTTWDAGTADLKFSIAQRVFAPSRFWDTTKTFGISQHQKLTSCDTSTFNIYGS